MSVLEPSPLPQSGIYLSATTFCVSIHISRFSIHRIVEKHLLQPQVMAAHGVKQYLRYRDDIFLLGSTLSGITSFFALMRQLLNGMWTVKVEGVSKTELPFLDVTFFKVFRPDYNSVCYRPYSKPTKVPIPLSIESAHPRAVHKWPIADALCLSMHSSLFADFRSAVSKYTRNLILHEHDIDVILTVLKAAHVHIN